MEHYAQAVVALSISSVLCLAAWIWARRRLTRFASVNKKFLAVELKIASVKRHTSITKPSSARSQTSMAFQLTRWMRVRMADLRIA